MIDFSQTKILADPVFTAKRISRCSSFWDVCKITHDFCAKHPGVHVTCIVPKDGSFFLPDYEALFVEFPLMKDWTFVPTFVGTDRYQRHWLPTDELQRVVTEYAGTHGDWDVLVTNRNAGLFYRRVESFGALAKFFFLYDTFPIFPFKATAPGGSHTHSLNGRFTAMQTLTNYMAFDKIVINAEFERREILKTARLFYSPAQVRRLSDSLHVAHNMPPLDTGFVYSDDARNNFIEPEQLSVLFAQKITESQRKFSDVFRSLQILYAKLAASQLKLKIEICTQSAAGLPKYARNDANFLSFVSLPRLKFWEKLRKTHIQLSFSIEEDMPKGMLEGVLMGVVPVVARHLWSEDFFGRDYPFFASNEAEAYAVIGWIGRNRADAWSRFVDWYRSYFAPTIFPRGTASELFTRLVESHISEQVRLAEAKRNQNELVRDIMKAYASGERVDLLCLQSRTGIFKNVYDCRKYVMADKPYSRLPSRWQHSFILRFLHGWKCTGNPWELICP
ncbi:MAG: hypothetical protein IJU37_07845 [Desulfovibrio sp.]|nr:hypothetical protein [Desulfovibrio sp.]